MQNFVRGQRAAISQICDSTNLEVRIALQSARVPVFDFVCFGLDEREQLADDRFMVFFNQKSAPDNAVILDNLSDQSATFSLDLNAVPPEVARLGFHDFGRWRGRATRFGKRRFRVALRIKCGDGISLFRQRFGKRRRADVGRAVSQRWRVAFVGARSGLSRAISARCCNISAAKKPKIIQTPTQTPSVPVSVPVQPSAPDVAAGCAFYIGPITLCRQVRLRRQFPRLQARCNKPCRKPQRVAQLRCRAANIKGRFISTNR